MEFPMGVDLVNYLVVDDTVSNQPMQISQVWQPRPKTQPTHANIHDSTPDHSPIIPIELIVYGFPASAGTQRDEFSLLTLRYLIKAVERYENPVSDGGMGYRGRSHL
jgi:hypothetical protein